MIRYRAVYSCCTEVTGVWVLWVGAAASEREGRIIYAERHGLRAIILQRAVPWRAECSV